MQDSRLIFDLTPGDFSRPVLENSHKGPVPLYLWSPRAGPCNQLLPRLVKLADEAAGRVPLALRNTDEQGRFARDLGIHSIPTVLIHTGRTVAETVHGAWPEAGFRRIVEKHAGSRRSALYLTALKARRAGEDDVALELLGKAGLNGGDWRACLDRLKLLRRHERLSDALTDIKVQRQRPVPSMETAELLTHLEISAMAGNAPDPETLLSGNPDTVERQELLFQIAAIQIVNDGLRGSRDMLGCLLDDQARASFRARTQRTLDVI